MDDRLLRDITILHELMQEGGWKSLAVKGENISLLLSDEPTDEAPAAAAPATAIPIPIPVPVLVTPGHSVPPDAMPATSADTINPGWIVVAAPNLGTFYRSPKPGSPAFVELGQAVCAGAELCIIEVMKLFTSVRAESAGIVRHVAVEDGQLVEGGQPLIYIECE